MSGCQRSSLLHFVTALHVSLCFEACVSACVTAPCRPDERAEVELARVSFLQNAKSARSDHIALVAAFNGWTRALSKGES